MKEVLRGKHYASDEEVTHALIQRWNIATEWNGDYVEK